MKEVSIDNTLDIIRFIQIERNDLRLPHIKRIGPIIMEDIRMRDGSMKGKDIMVMGMDMELMINKEKIVVKRLIRMLTTTTSINTFNMDIIILNITSPITRISRETRIIGML